MTRRIDLPNDGWAVIKDPSELSEMDRRKIRHAGVPLIAVRSQLRAAGLQKPPAELTEAESEQVMAITMASDAVSDQTAAIIAVYTLDWSYEVAISAEAALNLPGPVFDLLAAETTRLGDGTPDLSVDGAPDPASPTVPLPV